MMCVNTYSLVKRVCVGHASKDGNPVLILVCHESNR